MPKLILMFKDKTLSSHPLENGAKIIIGRHAGNDIVIDNQVVSGIHAHIEFDGKKITLTDLQSKNGTFCNGEPVSQAILHHDDVITIGKHTILIDSPVNADEEQATAK